MKIQERSGAAHGRSAAPAQPSVGDRLPTPPRERKPALAALAVLLILVGALGATMLVLQAGDRVEVVKVTKEIPAGGAVTDSNVTSVLVAEDSSIHYIKWEQLASLKKLKALNAIPAGAVPVGEMFGDDTGATQGKALVGLSLKAGQFPAGLEEGDVVAAYRAADGGSGSNSSASTSGSDNSVLAEKAIVTSVPDAASGDEIVSSSNTGITVAVDPSDAAALAQAAAANAVVLVLVPSSN
ncbi:hypothetical protein [Streptomyces sp. NPDC046909]|uniref:hypothetical protein n=1 Tax=Streptomyces sp. NPDC046909 TaxID=3155617 RepID=UPI0033FE07EE